MACDTTQRATRGSENRSRVSRLSLREHRKSECRPIVAEVIVQWETTGRLFIDYGRGIVGSRYCNQRLRFKGDCGLQRHRVMWWSKALLSGGVHACLESSKVEVVI